MRVVAALALACLALLPASRAPAAEAHAGPLRALLADPALRGARVGILVVDLETGDVVFERNPTRPLVPASNQKLFISAATLARWGPAHRFETPVLIDGEVDEAGVLHGVLWIVGRGDPTLVSESLWSLAQEIRLRGVREVRGGLGVDPSYFDRVHTHSDWEPISTRAYHARISAFAANYGSFRIEVAPGLEARRPARVGIAPSVPYLRLHSEASTLPRTSRLEVALERLPDGSGERVIVRGALMPGAEPRTFWRAVAMPEQYAAGVLRAQLEAQGVRVRGPVAVGRAPATARELLRFRGEPLALAVQRLNKYSNNFIAEQLVKALGAEASGAPGSWPKGIRAVRDYLDGIGAVATGTVIVDGSGLSHRNRVAPASLVQVIREASRRFDWGPEFLASLPLGGLDGTLEDRMEESPPPVRGKTGHLRHVASLSGVLRSGEGDRLAFAVIVNGARADAERVDAAIDAFVGALAGPPGEEAQGAAMR